MTLGDEGDASERPAGALDLEKLAKSAEPREVTSATFSYVDAMLAGRLSTAELDRIRAEILGGEDFERTPPAPESDPDQARLDRIQEDLAAGNYTTALVAADEILARRPGHALAQTCRDQAAAVLANAYGHYLGRGCDVPQLAVDVDKLGEYGVDRWAAYILSRIDGVSSIEDLVDVAGISRLDTLRLLYDLRRRGIVAIQSGTTPAAETPPVAVARIRLRRGS